MNTTIRRCMISDAHAIYELCREELGYDFSEEQVVQNVRRLIGSPENLLMVAVDSEDKVLGLSLIHIYTGETFALSARVIPDYADDLVLSWSSGDEKVARVDESGNVTAVAPGSCEIEARSANGRADYCRITVS